MQVGIFNMINEDTIRYIWKHGIEGDYHLIPNDELYAETYVREFWDNIFNFRKLFQSRQFSEDFLREILVPKTQFRNRWEWMELTQDLSEKFIEEFKDEWNWDHIFMYQKLSKDFIRRHKDKISDFVKEETDIENYL